MVKRDWIVRYVDLPPPSERRLTLQSWDTASKGGPDNDWSVCTTWILTRQNRWYLVDVWRRRVDYPALKTAVQALAKHWKARRVLVEDAGAGTSLVQELRGRVSGIIAVKPVGDKVSRMAVASAKFEAGAEGAVVGFPRGRAFHLHTAIRLLRANGLGVTINVAIVSIGWRLAWERLGGERPFRWAPKLASQLCILDNNNFPNYS